MLLQALIIGFSIMGVAHSSTAALWETEAEIEVRYGRCVEKKEHDPIFGNLYIYNYKDYDVRVTFIDGKSQSEYYTHQDGKTPLAAQEIEIFLEMNSFGKTWHRSGEAPLWRLGDSQAFAISPTGSERGLAICTALFAQWQYDKNINASSK